MCEDTDVLLRSRKSKDRTYNTEVLLRSRTSKDRTYNTDVLLRSRKSMDRQYNGQMKNYKMTNNDPQTIAHKITYRAIKNQGMIRNGK